MKSLSFICSHGGAAAKQRGMVLFFALIALVAMSLAALTLVRSVDTTTIIAGNLAFKQSATTSGDAGIEAAVAWLTVVDAANAASNVLTDATHPFNITNLATRPGYHSSVGTLDLFAAGTWNEVNNVLVGTDGSGNTIRYIIERMCRNANQAIQTANCLFSGAIEDTGGQQTKKPQDICNTSGCYSPGQPPQIRITTQTTGPRSTISYVQAFVY